MNNEARHVIAELRVELEKIEFERHSLVSFKGKPVMKRAFFPGGNGLCGGLSAANFPHRGTLILGSNFSAESGFVCSDGKLLLDDETSGPTWKPLRTSLEAAGFDLHECFFTNAWPCLHRGVSNTLGDLVQQWLANEVLMKECSDLFLKTYAVMQPSIVVALGPGPAAFLASVWPDQLSTWRGNNIRSMDSLPHTVIRSSSGSTQTVVTAIVHPSYQHINAKRRREPYRGIGGEIRLLAEAHTVRESLSTVQPS